MFIYFSYINSNGGYLSFFRKKAHGQTSQNPAPNQQVLSSRQSEFFTVLTKGLQLMSEKGMSRVVMSVCEAPRDMELVGNLSGGFVSTDKIGKVTPYYPFECLTSDEKKFVEAHQAHQVISLVVNDGTWDKYRIYADDGVEVANRTDLHWFLPQMKPCWEMHFGNTYSLYLGEEGLRSIAQQLSDTNPALTPQQLQENINEGMEEYRQVTRSLIGQSGLPSTLERIAHRTISAFDKMLLEMRRAIETAEKK